MGVRDMISVIGAAETDLGQLAMPSESRKRSSK